MYMAVVHESAYRAVSTRGYTNEMGGQNTYRKGCWSEEEDRLLRKYVEEYGQRNWKHIPTKSGLNRSQKSCRLRWLNYLRPDIKRGDFGEDEDDLIIRLHRLLGNRWSLIAGRLPGRTGNDIKNYWNSCLSKKIAAERKNNTMNQNSDTSPNNWDPSENDKDLDRKNETEEEECDMTTFWRSLLLERELLENEGMMKKVEDDDGDFFLGLGDLVQDMEFLVG